MDEKSLVVLCLVGDTVVWVLRAESILLLTMKNANSTFWWKPDFL